MKKSLLAFVLFTLAFTFNSCTDNVEENLELNEQEKQFINKGELGGDDDDEETGEEQG